MSNIKNESTAEAAYWSLLHLRTETQIDSLTFTQTALLVATFSPEEMDNWAAWYEGQNKWELLSKHLKTLKVERQTRLYKSQPAPPTDMDRDFENSGPVHRIVISEEMGSDSRMSKRFMKLFKAYVQADNTYFETTTRDISLTGIQLNSGVPLDTKGNVAVTLVNSRNESLELICTIIPDTRNNRLKIIRAAKLDILQKWLLDPEL